VIRAATYLTIKYPRMCDVRGAGHLRLATIGDPLLLEVPIDAVVLHEIAPRSAHRANNDFLTFK